MPISLFSVHPSLSTICRTHTHTHTLTHSHTLVCVFCECEWEWNPLSVWKGSHSTLGMFSEPGDAEVYTSSCSMLKEIHEISTQMTAKLAEDLILPMDALLQNKLQMLHSWEDQGTNLQSLYMSRSLCGFNWKWNTTILSFFFSEAECHSLWASAPSVCKQSSRVCAEFACGKRCSWEAERQQGTGTTLWSIQ